MLRPARSRTPAHPAAAGSATGESRCPVQGLLLNDCRGIRRRPQMKIRFSRFATIAWSRQRAFRITLSALGICYRIVLGENWFPLFRMMLWQNADSAPPTAVRPMAPNANGGRHRCRPPLSSTTGRQAPCSITLRSRPSDHAQARSSASPGPARGGAPSASTLERAVPDPRKAGSRIRIAAPAGSIVTLPTRSSAKHVHPFHRPCDLGWARVLPLQRRSRLRMPGDTRCGRTPTGERPASLPRHPEKPDPLQPGPCDPHQTF